MGRYILKRAILGIFTFLGVSVMVFVMGRMTGDPVRRMVPETATEETRQAVRERLNLDKPIPQQYLLFLKDLLHGDLGKSYMKNMDVTKLVIDRLPATFELAVLSIIVAILISIPLGTFCALKRNTIWDLFGSLIALIGQATPSFWLGLMLILIFSVNLKWLPISGRGTAAQLVLPTMTLALQTVGYFTRLMRSSMLEVIGQDYMRTARAKGLREQSIIFKHGMKNALIPVVTMIGMQFAWVLTGAFIVETIFAWPGIGRLGVNALFERDFALIQGVIILSSAIFVTVNLIVDILYTVLDPRISYKEG